MRNTDEYTGRIETEVVVREMKRGVQGGSFATATKHGDGEKNGIVKQRQQEAETGACGARRANTSNSSAAALMSHAHARPQVHAHKARAVIN